jgi:hypothetical protein
VLAETGERLDRENRFDGLRFQGIAFTIEVARRTRQAVRYAREARPPYIAMTVAWALDHVSRVAARVRGKALVHARIDEALAQIGAGVRSTGPRSAVT